MSTNASHDPVIVRPHEGEKVRLAGNEIAFKLTGEQSGGAFSVVEYTVAPNFEAPPVLHANTLEAWAGYVLEGALVFEFSDGRRFTAETGAFLFLPKGAMFKWWNETDSQARWLCIYSPAGFENYFREVSRIIEDFSPENLDIKQAMPQILPLWSKYGIE